MEHLSSLFLFLLLAPLCGCMPAQGNESRMQHRADSLRSVLRNTNSDTSRVRLRCQLGKVSGCRRPGYWDSVVVAARNCGSPAYEGMALVAAAKMLMYEPYEKKALDYTQQGYALALQTNDRPSMILCFINWAGYYCYMRNNAPVALDYCFKGLKLAEQINDDKSRNTLMTMAGTCYFAAGEYKKALDMHLKCLAIARKTGNANVIVSSLTDVGSDYHGMKQYTKASEYYLECKNYLPQLMNSAEAPEIATSIASGHLVIQQYDSARKYADMGIMLARRANNPRSTASVMVSVAGVQLSAHDPAAAKRTATEALEIIKPLHAPLLTSLLAGSLEAACTQLNDHKGALEAYKLYVSAKDSLSNETHRKRLMEMEFKYNLEKKENENRLLTLELKQNKYFQAIMALLVLFIFIVSYLFFRQIKLRSDQESHLLSQKLLRLQMNPHFIFNSLQAIQSFIINREVKESVHYLGAFSNVTRHVLENSRTDHIPLHKEIDLLTNYLQLQQLRFMNRFEYFIHVDEVISSSFIYIPPMLLQPFIENAVEHGMHDIEGGGRIEVWYRIENNMLFMEIIDNGYGMAANGLRNKTHRSLALEITRERITLMNKREKTKTIFTITDAFPDCERKGVKVVFRFSLSELQKRT